MASVQRGLAIRTPVVAVLAASCGLAAGVRGQTPTDGDALRGPSVKQAAASTTLVKRDMSGKMEMLDTRPEQAALGLLGLTPEQKKAADEVLATRYSAVTKLLRENYETFLKLQQARQSGAKREQIRPLVRELRPKADALLTPGLQEQVSAALPEEKRAEFKRIVDDYKLAMASEEPGGYGAGAGTGGGEGRGRARVKGDGDAGAPESMTPDGGAKGKAPEVGTGAKGDARVPPRVEMNLLLREMGRSLKGIVDERKEHLDGFLKAVDATPEQEAQIRALVREGAEKARREGGGFTEPTPQERAANWKKIMDVLTPEQRQKAMEARRAERGG